MDGSFVTELARRTATPGVLKLNGIERVVLPDGAGKFVLDSTLDVPEPEPHTLDFGTLAGFAGYIAANRDKLNLTTMIAYASWNVVSLLGPLTGPFKQRATYAQARLALFAIEGSFCFGQFLLQEDFVITLQQCFVRDEALTKVLRVVGAVRDESVRQIDDDGVTQTVTAKTGAVLRNDVALPNPVTLVPYRTFREVEQPASSFVLRAQRGEDGEPPSFGLFLADGESWKLTAAERVAKWLRDQLPQGLPVLA